MRRWRALWRTTAFRLAGFYMAVCVAALGLGLAFIYWATLGAIERDNRIAISEEVASLSQLYLRDGLSRLIVSIEDRVGPGIRTDTVYLLATPQGAPLAGNLNGWPRGVRLTGTASFSLQKREGNALVPRRVSAEMAQLPGGYRLLAGRDSEQQFRFRTKFLWAGTVVVLATLVVGLLAAIYAARRMLRRVDRAAQAAAAIASGNLDSRLPLAGRGDEFDRLAISLNRTLDRITDLVAGMRIATDSISHDVRRPLTRLRARLDLALRDPQGSEADAMATALVEIDKTVQILDNLLKIARAEAGVAAQDLVEVDLAQMGRDAVELYEPLAEVEGMQVTVAFEPAAVRAAPQLLAQALANLMDNAIKYGAAGGAIRVETGTDAGDAWIAVSDHGPGIAAQDRARATDRFVRLDDDGSRATEGSGLGLSLVRAVAHMLGGKLVLGDAQPGLRAEIRLPLLPQSGSG